MRGATSEQLAAYAIKRVRDRGLAVIPWRLLARPEQLPPTGSWWRTWLVLAGRGWGKTRTGAEAITAWVRDGTATRVAVVAQTAADARDVSVAALLRADPAARYEPSKRRIEWRTGARATTFLADDPDSLRGYEHDAAWSDELAAWRFPDAWDQLQFGLRAGGARQIVTTTPRPTRTIRELIASPTTVVTRGRTIDNAANLSAEAVADLLARYQGTRLGRQELDGEILDDVPGALWTRETIRYAPPPLIERGGKVELDLVRVIVAVDPNVSSEEGADEAGVTVHGLAADGRGFLLDDRSAAVGPMAWARRAVQAAADFKADAIVAEQNQGGEMVKLTIEQVSRDVPVRLVSASRGKRTRAEPVAMLYEQGRIFHVRPFIELEDQLCSWTPESGESPDRLDACVWGFSELMVGPTVRGTFSMVA